MANLQVSQIKRHLNEKFIPFVDSSDIIQTGEQKELHILSRAYAAYAVASLGNYEPKDVCGSITDEYDDNGIDLIYIDNDSKKMWLVQSKFSTNGDKGIDCGDLHKFKQGIIDLLNAEYSHFGVKTQKIKDSIDTALGDAQFFIYVVVAYTGPQLSKENHDIIDPFILENNDPTEIMGFEDFNLGRAHETLRKGLCNPITSQIHLKNWGQLTSPYKSIYGMVDATEIAQWWGTYGTNLFSKNIRHFLGNTESNSAMNETLTNNPELFKYFNNGVSILCDTYRKTPYGGANTDLGIFECDGIQIVNGAQTVGTIGEFYKTTHEGTPVAEVFVKIISLDGAPSDFPEKQTIANNTQNRVEKKDFVSLSPVQQRLKEELFLNGINYHLKRGREVPPIDEFNYTFEDAAIALATSQNDISLSVQAKREVGKLWESMNTAPYTELFNESLTSIRLMHTLRIYRAIQTQLKTLMNSEEGRNKRILILGNLFITHLIMQQTERCVLENKSLDVTLYLNETIKPLVGTYAAKTIEAVNTEYQNSNIPQLFRNFTKCRHLKDIIEAS